MKQALNKTIILLVIISLSACNNHKQTSSKVSSWQLSPEFSTISFITTKNDSISEVSHFTQFNASIDENYKFSASIDLKSLESNIPIRNERIQAHLFESDTFPTAEIHAQLSAEDLMDGVHEIEFDLDLHGVSNILHAEFMVQNKDDTKIVTLHKPLVVSADYFGMKQGVTTLRTMANLNSINFTVPMHLILTFEKN
jgi:polyisoprenoid-binding protein YceI